MKAGITIKQAIETLNEHTHPVGGHIMLVSMRSLPQEEASQDTPHNLMRQTYDWRYGKPDKEEYTITLTADDIKYLGHAIEVYNKAQFELHIAPHIQAMMQKLGEAQEEE